MSETFIEIDSLQHLETSRQTYPTNRLHFSLSIVNVLRLKDAINSNQNVLVMEVCIVRIILEKLA